MGNEYAVYLDIVFVINFCMDYVLLWATAKFCQLQVSKTRIAVGAFIGALYSLALLIPSLDYLLSVTIKIAFSIAMVLVSFPYRGFKKFLQLLGYFYLIAFTMGGAMLGAIYFISERTDVNQAINGIFIYIANLKFTWLLVAVAAAVFLVRYGVVFVKKNFLSSLYRVPIVVQFGDHKIATQALMDTGNQLKDPLTQKPVIIMEYGLLKKILPPEIAQSFLDNGNPDLESMVASLNDSFWASRVRVIPFSSIGKHRGMLIGLRPNEAAVITNEGTIKVRDVIVGIYSKDLSPEGSYRALLHPDILHMTI
ncbi:MAG: sigma-E processing peptidase SpoIIGA [Clostridia bacterium]|nr:sigma-E processing peptidase SpoIIGA [Clostridia bacterium]